MPEQVIGYVVRVLDGQTVIHEQEFLMRDDDPPDSRHGNALRRAENHARSMGRLYPEMHVENDCVCKELGI